jgi:hypothetical protein
MRLIKVGADFICLGVAIKPKDKDVFSIEVSKEEYVCSLTLSVEP